MNVQRGKLVSGGRLQLPAAIRENLGLADGDSVTMQVIDGELRVRPLRDVLSRIQARLGQYISADTNLADELIVDRKAAADHE